MNRCKKCGRLIDLISPVDTQTECICTEFVAIDGEGEKYSIYGVGAEDALERFAEKRDPGNDYVYLENVTTEFLIRKKGETDCLHVRLSAEQTARYDAEILYE